MKYWKTSNENLSINLRKLTITLKKEIGDSIPKMSYSPAQKSINRIKKDPKWDCVKKYPIAGADLRELFKSNPDKVDNSNSSLSHIVERITSKDPFFNTEAAIIVERKKSGSLLVWVEPF